MMNETSKAEEKLPLAFIVTFNAIAAITIIINGVHLSVVWNQPTLQKAKYYNYKLFLIILAAMDLLLGVVRLMLSNGTMQHLLAEHSAFCAATAVYLHTTYASMVSVIVMVSIDRAYCLKQSVTYQSREFVKWYPKIIVLVIAFYTILYSSIGIAFHKTGFSVKDVGPCNFGSNDIPMLGLPTNLAILFCWIVMIAVYIYTLVLLRIYVAKSKTIKKNRHTSEVTKTIGGIISSSILCWLPPIFSAVLWASGIVSVELEIFALIMLELNSLANPLLYGLANSTYRNLIYQKISYWRCQSPARVSPLPTLTTNYVEDPAPTSSV